MNIGIDIVKISDIKRNMEKKCFEIFLGKIYTQSELSTIMGQVKSRRLKSLASRFAVKEAALKALGTGVSEGLSFKDVETISEKNGKPLIVLNGKALERSKALGITEYDVSISYSDDFAIAFVIMK